MHIKRHGGAAESRISWCVLSRGEPRQSWRKHIHLNPIRTSRFKDADYATKSEYHKNYPWSTFAGYCYLRKRKENFDYGWLLSTYFGDDTIKYRRPFRQYVYHAIESEIESPFEEVVHQSILGAADFVEWVRQKLPRKGQRSIL